MTSPGGQLWLPREVWRHCGHSEIPALGETAPGAGRRQAEEDRKGERMATAASEQIQSTDAEKKKVIKRKEAELKGHFRAAMW